MNINNEVVKLLASDGAANDYFGVSLAISNDGNIAIVGVPHGRNEKGIDTGTAYIYTRTNDTWSQQSKLVATDGASGDWFGRSVAITGDGSTVIVGANGDNNEKGINTGSVYVYTRSDDVWIEQTKLLADNGSGGDQYGYSVAISSDGNTAIVGTYGDDSYRGSAYIYTRNDTVWAEQCKLIASDGSSFDYYGISVAISDDGNTVIIGAYGDDNEKGHYAGSAYIYTRSGDTWGEQAKLVASDGAGGNCFGWSVSISGDAKNAIVGTYYDDDGRGSTYAYSHNGNKWVEEAKLLASDRAVNDYFGRSISISSDGNTAIVGAANDDSKGSAYIFTRSGSTWTQKAKLIASDGSSFDFFGYSVSINGDGNTAIVGAHSDDNEKGTDAGSAYIFDLT